MPDMEKKVDSKEDGFREKYLVTWKRRWESFLNECQDAEGKVSKKELAQLALSQIKDIEFLCSLLDEKFNSTKLSPKMEQMIGMIPDIIKELGEDFVNAKTDDMREEARRKLRAALEIGQLRKTLGRSGSAITPGSLTINTGLLENITVAHTQQDDVEEQGPVRNVAGQL